MEVENNESISSKGIRTQLKKLAAEVKQKKDFRVIIMYYGRQTHSGAALRMTNQIKNYLVKNSAIESKWIFAIYGGNKERQKRIRIFLVPPDESGNNQTSDSNDIMNYLTKQYNQRVEQPFALNKVKLNNHPINAPL
jgi:multidrug efflux pump subunit AcrB